MVANVAVDDALNLRASPSPSARIVDALVPERHGINHLDGVCRPTSTRWASRWCPVTHYYGDKGQPRLGEGSFRERQRLPLMSVRYWHFCDMERMSKRVCLPSQSGIAECQLPIAGTKTARRFDPVEPSFQESDIDASSSVPPGTFIERTYIHLTDDRR